MIGVGLKESSSPRWLKVLAETALFVRIHCLEASLYLARYFLAPIVSGLNNRQRQSCVLYLLFSSYIAFFFASKEVRGW
eukprot:m.49083 g.49083  ORF g.49083 m.49083 type:complete len:79 (-) comp13342_c0_seq7:297-533(-)